MTRRHDERRIKDHLSYSAAELARTLKVNTVAVYRWKGEGLRPIPGIYPQLYSPDEIVRFLRLKNKPRQPLQPGEIYCVACKRAQRPVDNVVSLVPRRSTNADLVGECPGCGRWIFRRVSLSKLEVDRGTLEVRYEDGTVPISTHRDGLRSVQSEGQAS